MTGSMAGILTRHKSALSWLAVFAALGTALVFLYVDADQQDAGYHYLFARWSWQEPYYLIGVWTRPLFTLIYSAPAQLGYPAAKIFTLLISLVAAWQTYRLALLLKLERAHLAIPLLLLQPALFLLFTETQTETLFALLFVIALRLHYSGWIRASLIVVSMLILVRPEGFFLGVAWGLWIVIAARQWTLTRRIKETLWLATGAFVWWAAASLLTRDPLWILHDWPTDWHVTSEANGRGPLLWYFALLPLIVGPLFLPQFVLGLRKFLRDWQFAPGVMSFLALFALHSVMFWRGWFGAAGYPRYLVCVAPAVAIIALSGWSQLSLLTRRGVQAAILVLSLLVCLFYVDGYRYTRDGRAVDDALSWLKNHPVSFSRLVFSQSYMCIRLDCQSADRLILTSDRAHNLSALRDSNAGTLVFWDLEVGPKWFGLSATDFERLGYKQLFAKPYRLDGWFFRLNWRHHGGPRLQEIYLYYR